MPAGRQRVSPTEHPTTHGIAGLDWEGTRIFLEVARLGGLRPAAKSLHLTVNKLRRRLNQLEHDLGMTLVTRHVDGVRLTPEGTRLLAAAQQMETAAFAFVRGQGAGDSAGAGRIKLAVTEGLATYWVMPRLAGYLASNPNLSVQLNCTMVPPDVLRLEADVSIQLVRPSAKDLKLVKLGRMHITAFASKSYVAAHRMPKNLADLEKHRLVSQLLDQELPVVEQPGGIQNLPHSLSAVVRTNTSSTHYAAILHGAGIGMLPTYGYALDDSLVPVDIGYRTYRDIWLVYHPDSGKIARVRALIRWLIRIFSPQQNPWFGDDFVHPGEFPAFPSAALIPKKLSEAGARPRQSRGKAKPRR